MTEENDFSRFLELNNVDEMSVPEHLNVDAEEALARMNEQNAMQSTAELSGLEEGEQEEIVQDAISRLSDNVREEAVEIARDILKKLKITLGNVLLEDGIHLKFLDKEEILRMLGQVEDVWEYLIASARALDEELLENAIIYNAIVAMDRLQHAVMADKLTRAQRDGDMDQASKLSGKMEKMPQHAKNMSGTFGDLLTKIDNGMKLIMQQMKQRGAPDAMADNWRGLTNYSAIGGRDTEDDQREKRNIKSLEHVEQREAIAAKKTAYFEAQQQARQTSSQQSKEGEKQAQRQQQESSRQTIRARMAKLLGGGWLTSLRSNMAIRQQQQQVQVQMNIRHVARKNVKIQQELMNDMRRNMDKQRDGQQEQRMDAIEQKQDLQALEDQLKDFKKDSHGISDVGADFDPSKDKKDLDPNPQKKFTDRFR